MLFVFRTVLFHHQEQLYKLYIAFGICRYHTSGCCVANTHKTNKMHEILVIRLYFPLDALHVTDCISPSLGATFISCTSHLVYAGICQT